VVVVASAKLIASGLALAAPVVVGAVADGPGLLA
jgi:hypothetical protein